MTLQDLNILEKAVCSTRLAPKDHAVGSIERQWVAEVEQQMINQWKELFRLARVGWLAESKTEGGSDELR